MTAGNTYQLCVGSLGDPQYSTKGSIVMSLNMNTSFDPYSFSPIQHPASVANDNFANAITLTGMNVSAMGYNVEATSEGFENGAQSVYGFGNLWWKWRAPTSGETFVSAVGSTTDTTLSIWTLDGSNLPRSGVAAGNNVNGSFTAQSGVDYYISMGSSTTFSNAWGTLFFTISGAPSAPVFTAQPQSQLAYVGSTVNLTTDVDGTGTEFEWFRDGRVIDGASSRVLILSGVSLSDAGDYVCTATNSVGSVDSHVASLVIVDKSAVVLSVKEGGSISATATAAAPKGGSPLSFRWRKGGVPLSDDARIKGSSSSKLSIKSAGPADEGDYTCAISRGSLSGTSGTTAVQIQRRPVINPVSFPSVSVASQVSVMVTAQQGASQFSARGLPSGLKIDKNTGQITGSPTKAGSFNIAFQASNAAGKSDVLIVPVVVSPLDSRNLGQFDGLVFRGTSIDGGLGGSASISVSSSGAVSAKFILGATSYSTRGMMTVPVAGDPTATMELKQRGGDALVVRLSFVASSERLYGTISNEADSLDLRADRRYWDSRNRPATGYSGTYSVAMDIPTSLEGNDTYPQGVGYLALAVSTSGAIRFQGKLSDGARLSGATYLWRTRYIPFFGLLKKEKTSVVGYLRVLNSLRVVSESLDWHKPGPSSSKDRLYRDGFPAFALECDGSQWVVPGRGENVLGTTGELDNGRIQFAEGGIDLAEQGSSLNQIFSLTSQGKVTFDPSAKSTKMALKVNSKNGTFSGGFSLTDAVPGEKPVTRGVKFEGIFLPHLNEAFGFFLLPQLPDASSSPPTTLKNSDILSGQVFITPSD